MPILPAILGMLAALPEIIKLGREVFVFFKKLVGDSPEKFIKDLNEAFSGLNNAETSEQRQAAAAALQKLIKRL